MSRIHIARDRQPLGNFSPPEVAEGLKSGRFRPTDLAWQEPMETWKALGEFTNLPEVEEDDDELLAPLDAPVAPTGSSTEGLPWERRAELGLYIALRDTIKLILSEPTATFRAMGPGTGLHSPLLYYVVLGTLGTWMALACDFIAKKVSPTAAEGLASKISSVNSIGTLIGSAIVTPIFLVLATFVASGIIHAVILALGGEDKKFAATFRAYCYSVGTAYVLMLIPICGGFAFLIVAALLLVIALREIHAISTAKAIVATVLPGLLYFLVAGAALLLLLAASGSLK
jgi:hypothetical protein